MERNIPHHIAIIMDGNGRWAKKRGLARSFGHMEGAKTLRKALEYLTEIGVKYLTVYAFLTENWNRPQDEVSTLMKLFLKYIKNERKNMMKNKIRFFVSGRKNNIPEKLQKKIAPFLDRLASARLTARELDVARFYEDNLPGAALLNLEEVCRAVGVSSATVGRFARKLGYSDFRAMSRSLRAGVREDLSLPVERLQRLHDGVSLTLLFCVLVSVVFFLVSVLILLLFFCGTNC